MGQYFDDLHAKKESQLSNEAVDIKDSREISDLRLLEPSEKNLSLLENALKNQLRFKECIELLTKLIEINPENTEYKRKRAGRYLSTLQCDKAVWDFFDCLAHGGDKLDIYYRIGLCRFFQESYESALAMFEDAYRLADDEMGIAAMYWHTLACARVGAYPILLSYYSPDMKTGHHTAYDLAMSVWANRRTAEEALKTIENEKEDMEYVISAYGIALYMKEKGRQEEYKNLMNEILNRDGFWHCFSYLAAFNDYKKGLR